VFKTIAFIRLSVLFYPDAKLIIKEKKKNNFDLLLRIIPVLIKKAIAAFFNHRVKKEVTRRGAEIL